MAKNQSLGFSPCISPLALTTRPSALGMTDPGVEPLEILEILELETPPYPRPPCRCPPCCCPPCRRG